MINFFYDVFVNVLANLIATGILAIALGVIFQLPNKRAIRKFFGFNKQKSLNIYFSSLWVKGTAQSIVFNYKNESRSFRGVALPGNEFGTLPTMSNTFSFITDGNNFLSTLINRIIFKDIDIQYLNSPTSEEIPGDCNIITIGSKGYNSVSEYFESKVENHLKFNKNNNEILYNGNIIASPTAGYDYAIIEKFIDDEGHRVMFYLAGFDVIGTKCAVEYLMKNWGSLYKLYGEGGFAICIKTKRAQSENESSNNISVVFQKAID